MLTAWSDLLRAHRPPFLAARWVSGLLTPILLISGIEVHTPAIAFALMVAFGSFVLLNLISTLIDKQTLRCPHCHESPVKGLNQESPRRVDFCQRCHYWLRSPW